MSQPFATGRKSIGVCDRCGRLNKLNTLKWQTINLRNSNLLVCPECLDQDHPQYMLGRFPIVDPQALRNPRPDSRTDVTTNPVFTGSYTDNGWPIYE